MIAIPMAALLADCLGCRPLLLAGGGIAAVGPLVLLAVPRLSAWLYVGQLVRAFGKVLSWNSGLTLLTRIVPPERRAKGIGLFMLYAMVADRRGYGAMFTVAAASLSAARTARDILRANGIVDGYPVFRRLANLKTVSAYEGTRDLHTLIVGQAITGLNAFS